MEVESERNCPNGEKVSCFEFLLDDSLLEKHLNSENPDPTPSELVSLFLYQADVTASTVKEIGSKEPPDATDILQDNSHGLETRKVRALRHLALRVACHLKWNLTTLCNSVPLAIVQSLLLEFLKATSPEEDLTLKHPNQLDMSTVAPQALFALLLYHLWCLRTAVQESFPVRPSKVPNVQVPGILDPTVLSSNMKDAVLQSVREGLEDSVKVLETYVNQSRDVSLPKPASIGAIVLGDMVGHDWCLVHTISGREMSAQIYYDLGSYYFHQLVYPKALQAFMETHTSIKQLKQMLFCEVNSDRLLGYLSACQGVVQGVKVTSKNPVSGKQRQSLLCQAEKCLKENAKGIVDILVNDNSRQELSLQYRAHVLRTVQKSDSTLQGKVVILNAIRLALEGHLALPGLIPVLRGDPSAIDSLIKNVDKVILIASDMQKNHLKALIGFIHDHLAEDTPKLTQKIFSSNLKSLFSSREELSPKHHQHQQSKKPPFTKPDDSDISSLEQQLLVSYEATTIRSLVSKLHPKIGKSQTMHLSDQWQVPRELAKMIDSLPIPNPTIQVYVYILMAKVRLCLRLNQYEKARDLLSAADAAVNEVSYKLSKQLKWEVLRTDLSQFTASGTSSVQMELVKRARSCLAAKDSEVGSDLTTMCCVFLMNNKDWEHLSSVKNRSNPNLQLTTLIAALCQELPLMQNSRKPGRDLWEALIMIFTSPSQQKRNISGGVRDVHHESHLGIMSASAFTQFMLQLKESVALTAVISCLCKFVSIIKSLSTELYSDYMALWPSAISNSSALNADHINASLHQIVLHALSTNSNNPSWLHTNADICYNETRYSSALKFYLLYGHVMTDAFSEPITKNVYNDGLYQRLIKCCSQIKCHTQVAVLCQCLEEVDYAHAFKALQETTSNDAMDSLYSFIWDVSIMEFLIYHHAKQGETKKKNEVIKLMGQMELNCSNPSEIQQEAARIRKAAFFQTLMALYV